MSNSVDKFLRETRKFFDDNKNLQQINIVLGNQSADLDSIACAIAYAYFQTRQTGGTIFLPVLNTTKQILDSKNVCMFALRECGVDVKNLIFLEELRAATIANAILVDHNELEEHVKTFNLKKIIRIVDHHRVLSRTSVCDDRRLANAGSCASMVAREIEASETALDPTFGKLLLLAIIHDTNNLTQPSGSCPNDEIGMTTDIDVGACNFLSKRTNVTENDRKILFTTIRELKYAVSLAPLDLLLAQDYKQYPIDQSRFGFSSVMFSLAGPNWPSAKQKTIIENFMFIHKCTSFAVLGTYLIDGDQIHRDLAFFGSRAEELRNSPLADRLLVPCRSGNNFAVFKVKDNLCTRKFWAPTLIRFLETFVE